MIIVITIIITVTIIMYIINMMLTMICLEVVVFGPRLTFTELTISPKRIDASILLGLMSQVGHVCGLFFSCFRLFFQPGPGRGPGASTGTCSRCLVCTRMLRTHLMITRDLCEWD